MIRSFFLWLALFLVLYGTGQVKLAVVPMDSAATGFKVPVKFANKAVLSAYLQDLPAGLISKGYLTASIDSIALDSPLSKIHLYLGPKYKWANFTVEPAFQLLAQEIGLPGYSRKLPAFIDGRTDYREKILDYFAEQGYPFASVGFDSVQMTNNELSGKLIIEKGAFYKIDSIAQHGSLRLNPVFLNRYLGLSSGAPFQASRIQKIGQRLEELTFAEQVQPWDLSMLGTGGVVNVYLKQRRSNVLNVLLGVMPASTQTPGNKVLITGDANILLKNSFRSGETIGINWQQIQYQSPRLDLLYQQPYLFGSRAGIDFMFELFKKDTQFVNLQVRLGMPYEFSIDKAGKVMFHYTQTNVTSVDTATILATRQLPDLAATAATSLGFEYALNTTNYRLNPRNGNELTLYMVGGTKTIKPSSDIQNLKDPANAEGNFSFLYDSLELNTYQVRIKLIAAKYFSVGTSSVFKIGLNAGTYESGNFFRNELFQIGGFRLLRGFDEESIFARRYGVMTTEYRLLSGKNSYFFGFLDGGFAQYKDEQLQFSHNYIGTGIGMVLETKNSLINISWAVGKRNDQSVDFRQSKIHLGLINFF
jgi:outer membrane protein assembly factor BamA